MILYDSRKVTLAETFGENSCIVDKSWLKASFQDLNGEFKIYPDDLEFMYKERKYCSPTKTQTETKIIIREYNGLKANVTIDGKTVGLTNEFIVIKPGEYTAEISKNGYITQSIALIAAEGKTTEYKSVSLIKEKTPTTPISPNEPIVIETPHIIGALVEPTMKTKMPTKIIVGDYNWFGWEFNNVGDEDWKGMVGVKLVDSEGSEFKWTGDAAKKQSLKVGEIKYLWAYCLITDTIKIDENTKIYALLTAD